MQLNDAALEQLLGQVQDEYEKQDLNWKPDPGDYPCLLTALFFNIFKNDEGKDVLSITAEFLIVGGQLEGRIFRLKFTDGSPGSFRHLRKFVDKCLTAEEYGLEPSGNLRDDLKTLDSLKGRLFVGVRTTKSVSQKNGETYINGAVTKVESIEEPAEAAAQAA